MEFPLTKRDPHICAVCNGTGFCLRCSGNGRYLVPGITRLVMCTVCEGSGACRSCDGTGRVRTEAEDD